MVCERTRLCRVLGMDPLADWIRLPGVWRERNVADGSRTVALQEVRKADVCDCRNGFRGQPQAAAPVVPRHVADDGTEDRVERPQPLRHVRFWELPDGMGAGCRN